MSISTPTTAVKPSTTEYQIVQMQENAESSDATSSNLSVSSLRNTSETIVTTLFKAGKWLATHPVQSILTGSALLAIGLGAGFGIPALMESFAPTKSLDKMKCSDLNVLSFGANQGANFSFSNAKSGDVLAQFLATESSRVDLDMTGLCEKPENILNDSFLVSCNDVNVLFQPTDLTQEIIAKKLSETECNPLINSELIFQAELKPATTSTIKLDGDKMCDEGKIKDFSCKGYVENGNSILDIISPSPSYKMVINRAKSAAENSVYHIDTQTHCKEIVNQRFTLVCTNDGVDFHYSFTPALNLTASSVANLDFGHCTATKQDKSVSAKTCQLWSGVEPSTFGENPPAYRDKTICKASASTE